MLELTATARVNFERDGDELPSTQVLAFHARG
jgi:hypothetical protein